MRSSGYFILEAIPKVTNFIINIIFPDSDSLTLSIRQSLMWVYPRVLKVYINNITNSNANVDCHRSNHRVTLSARVEQWTDDYLFYFHH